ncbi:hypothetical protein KY289_027097 [Solanum tuberosum]|nr:hypothetical protein KY289_027097 [Solanum tuberosum]KAH0661985.1 hypothetical protein KY284_026916 [Solanum tuberosum]
MGVSYLSVSAFCTVLSYVGLQCWMGISVEKLKSDGLIGESIINFGNESRALENLLGSHTTIALGANFAVNAGKFQAIIKLFLVKLWGDSFLMMDMVMV